MKLFADKKVLVTGATGLIGSHLVRYLLKEGATVIAAGRNEEKIKHIFRKNITDIGFHYRIFDAKQEIPCDIGRIDYIFHAASPISGKEIQSRPVDVIDVNIKGTENCLKYLQKQKEDSEVCGRLIIFSSVTIYGNPTDRDRVVCEADTYMSGRIEDGSAPYAEAKRIVEVMARAYYRQYGVDVVIARIGWVYGFTENMPDTAFYQFIRNAIKGEDIVLSHSGLGKRDNIYVEDVVDALVLLALYAKSGEVYNVSSGQDKENFKAIDEIARDIACSVNEITGKNSVHVVSREDGASRDPGIAMDNSKLKKLGWSLHMGMQDGIKQTVKQYLSQGF